MRLGSESSFDAWVYGEWVREVLFRNFEDALRRSPRLVREYLTTNRGAPDRAERAAPLYRPVKGR